MGSSIRAGESVRLSNLPQSDEFMVNSRNEVLNVRTYMPADGVEIKALLVFVHGYGGHVNSRPKEKFGLALASKGVAGTMIDLPGHGYSQGERAYISNYRFWLQDHLQLLEAILGGGFADDSKGRINLSAAQLERLKSVPFFLSGESLGGGITIFTGLALQDRKHPLLPRFKGAVLIAPAIQGNPPPPPVVAILRYLVAPVIPKTQIPDMLESVKIPHKVWKTEEDRKIVERDNWGNPGGIGWGHNMKYKMGMNMLDLTKDIYRRLSDVQFPFLILHDPEDAIVQFGPSREMMDKASTPRDDPRARELKEMNDWLHDLLTNCTDEVVAAVSDWVLYQAERFTA